MRKVTALLLALVLVTALLAGCGSGDETPVSVQSVSMLTGLGPIGVFDRFAGVVEAGKNVNVQKDSSMELDEVLVQVGDSVAEGDILFTYNTESLSLELDKLELELEQLKNSQETKRSQIATLEAEKKKASADNQLSYTLQIQTLEVEIREAEYSIASKQKNLDSIRATLEDSTVVSPCDGTVKSISSDNGGSNGWIDTGSGSGDNFIVITQTGDYRIKGTVNEQNRAMLSEGMPVIIRSRADDTTWSGSISLIDTDNPIQDNSNNNWGASSDEQVTSSNYPFYVELDSSENLMIGQHVYIEPDHGQQEQVALALPAYFIVTDEDEPYVWAANDSDELERRFVTLGDYDPAADTYVIAEGLELSDYIADPSEPCSSGVPVNRYDSESFGGDYSTPEGGEAVEGEGNFGLPVEGFDQDYGVDDGMNYGVDDGMDADGAVEVPIENSTDSVEMIESFT